MPRTRNSGIDVTLHLHKASLSQLTRLSKEVLQLHLSSLIIYARGTRKELARVLFNALHKKPLGLQKRQQSSTPLVSSASTTKKNTRKKRKTIKQDVPSQNETKIPKTKNRSKKKKSNPENVFCLPAPESTIMEQIYDYKTKDKKMMPSNANQSSSNLQSTTCNSLNTSMPLLLISREIRDSIVKGEFIDFTQLLPRVIFAKSNQSSLGVTRLPLKITSFADWMEAWNNYLTVAVAHNPNRALELIGYQMIITSASSQVPLHKWLMYDVQFRMLAAFNDDLRWDTRHQDLWLQCLVTGQCKQEHDDILDL